MMPARHGVGGIAMLVSELQEAFTKAVERAWESTVNVGVAAMPPSPRNGQYWRQGFGSGVVLDREGHVITNHHVVAGADKIIVTLADGRVLTGSTVGSDEETDVAVVKVDAKDLKPATFGNSDALKVGQPVLAIGNPLGLAGGATVTYGVVSSLRRSVQLGNGGLKVIQTDAAVNPGNSGGPLVDLEGRVIAINTVTIPYAEGIGFAIPVNMVLAIADQILRHGRVERSWLGVSGYDVSRRVANYYGLPVSKGVFVAEISPDSPADGAGLSVGDVILSIAGTPVGDVADLVEAIRDRKIGESVEIEIVRAGRKATVKASLGQRPF